MLFIFKKEIPRFINMHLLLTNLRSFVFLFCLFCGVKTSGQELTPNLKKVSIEKNENFSGFELFEFNNERLFVLAEHWHNIRSVPRATMKLLKYLHKHANVRVLAIEQGNSAAHLINEYLAYGDTLILRQIARNTMFWGKENYAFFQDLYEFNKSLPRFDHISVRSIDIEYKMESAIFVINELIGNKKVPESLSYTVGLFQQLFEDTREHREQFDGLAVMYYYDREFVTELVKYTLSDIAEQPSAYSNFFGSDVEQFTTMIRDMDNGLYFDYTNPNTNYKFRDQLIYERFNDLLKEKTDVGVLCVIGLRHAVKPSSIYRLTTEQTSPVYDKIVNIRISALHLNRFKTGDLRRINFNYPKLLRENSATLIKHDPNDPALKSKSFQYTLFINENGSLTPFENILKEDY